MNKLLILSMPGADEQALAAERERVLAQVSPGVDVVITKATPEHQETLKQLHQIRQQLDAICNAIGGPLKDWHP